MFAEALKDNTEASVATPICGVVMPISAIDGCDETHWAEVLAIISDAIESAGYTANLVSNSEDVGIIQKRIVQNLYDNPIVVCDVSGKNPNVMFELGMRLAFDKPTIIVKDEKTSYSFDTSPIEHITYPRDLRFNKIVDFKERLAAKIKATALAANKNSDFSPFLRHFGAFTVAKIETKEVSAQEYILEEIRQLRDYVYSLTNKRLEDYNSIPRLRYKSMEVTIRTEAPKSEEEIMVEFDEYIKNRRRKWNVESVISTSDGMGHIVNIYMPGTVYVDIAGLTKSLYTYFADINIKVIDINILDNAV